MLPVDFCPLEVLLMQTKSRQILPPWLQLDFWLSILEFHSSVPPCASLAEEHFSLHWGQPAHLASIAPGKTRALGEPHTVSEPSWPVAAKFAEGSEQILENQVIKEIILLTELCPAACQFISQLLLWRFLSLLLLFASWWNMTSFGDITEEEGLHLIFLTYFTSLSPVWLCWCLAISFVNASFYPNHSPDFFPRALRPGFKAGGQLLLFCSKIIYCTKNELVLVSTSVHMGFLNKRLPILAKTPQDHPLALA